MLYVCNYNLITNSKSFVFLQVKIYSNSYIIKNLQNESTLFFRDPHI